VLEPTHGVVVGDRLCYIATSQWQSFDAEGGLKPEDQRTPAVVRRIALPPAGGP
jgi:hypothetical protein